MIFWARVGFSQDDHSQPKVEGDHHFGFSMAYQLHGTFDIRSASKRLPEAVTICNPKLVAGQYHVLGILSQAKEYWLRSETLARNKSIDLLMRITCQKQIADAVIASGISKTDAVAIFGFVKNESQINSIIEIIKSVAKDMKRGDDLLSLGQRETELSRDISQTTTVALQRSAPGCVERKICFACFG